MKRLNILDLHRTINEKKEKRIMCFEKVLEMAHNKIKSSAALKQLSCIFTVPTYVFGFPLFNVNECIEFVSSELKSNGFIVNYYFPNKLYISWDLNEIEETKKASKKSLQSNELPLPTAKPKSMIATSSLMKYKPSGKLEMNLV